MSHLKDENNRARKVMWCAREPWMKPWVLAHPPLSAEEYNIEYKQPHKCNAWDEARVFSNQTRSLSKEQPGRVLRALLRHVTAHLSKPPKFQTSASFSWNPTGKCSLQIKSLAFLLGPSFNYCDINRAETKGTERWYSYHPSSGLALVSELGPQSGVWLPGCSGSSWTKWQLPDQLPISANVLVPK